MPLFDINTAKSCELPAAYQLRTRLSEVEAIQDLAEAVDASSAVTSIIVGIAGDPLDGEGYTIEELRARHFVARVYAESEEGHIAGLGPEAMGATREGGVFKVYLRRNVREAEDRTDAYNFFWDRISATESAVIAASETTLTSPRNYRFKRAGRMIGPDFGERKAEGDQGVYLLSVLSFIWGDVENE